MSTYYYFKCQKCNRKGGFYSRQAWGWGNFDVIDSFKFIAYHTERCGEEHIRVISEHNDDYEEDLNSEILDFYQKDTTDIFPSSNDWRFMNENGNKEIEQINLLWVKEATRGIVPDNGIRLRGIIMEIEYEQKRRGIAYKAFLRTDKGEEYTFVGVDSELLHKDQLYYLLGEVVADDSLGRMSIGEIKGKLIQVFDMKRLSEPE